MESVRYTKELNHFFQANSFGPREGGGEDEHSPLAEEILAGFMEGVEEQQAQEAKEAEERAMAEPEPEDMSELEEGVWKPWPEAKPLFSDFDDLFRKPSDERSGASESREASIASTEFYPENLPAPGTATSGVPPLRQPSLSAEAAEALAVGRAEADMARFIAEFVDPREYEPGGCLYESPPTSERSSGPPSLVSRSVSSGSAAEPAAEPAGIDSPRTVSPMSEHSSREDEIAFRAFSPERAIEWVRARRSELGQGELGEQRVQQIARRCISPETAERLFDEGKVGLAWVCFGEAFDGEPFMQRRSSSGGREHGEDEVGEGADSEERGRCLTRAAGSAYSSDEEEEGEEEEEQSDADEAAVEEEEVEEEEQSHEDEAVEPEQDLEEKVGYPKAERVAYKQEWEIREGIPKKRKVVHSRPVKPGCLKKEQPEPAQPWSREGASSTSKEGWSDCLDLLDGVHDKPVVSFKETRSERGSRRFDVISRAMTVFRKKKQSRFSSLINKIGKEAAEHELATKLKEESEFRARYRVGIFQEVQAKKLQAYQEMSDTQKSETEVASTIAEKAERALIEQRQRLSAVHDRILQATKEGLLSKEGGEALTPVKQEKSSKQPGIQHYFTSISKASGGWIDPLSHKDTRGRKKEEAKALAVRVKVELADELCEATEAVKQQELAAKQARQLLSVTEKKAALLEKSVKKLSKPETRGRKGVILAEPAATAAEEDPEKAKQKQRLLKKLHRKRSFDGKARKRVDLLPQRRHELTELIDLTANSSGERKQGKSFWEDLELKTGQKVAVLKKLVTVEGRNITKEKLQKRRPAGANRYWRKVLQRRTAQEAFLIR